MARQSSAVRSSWVLLDHFFLDLRVYNLFFSFFLGHNIGGKTKSKLLIVEELYLELEDLKQNKPDVKREGGEQKERRKVVLPSKRAYLVHQAPPHPPPTSTPPRPWAFGIFNMHADDDACACTHGLCGHHRKVCTGT